MQLNLKTACAYLTSASAGILLLGATTSVHADHHDKSSITDIVLQSGGSFDHNRNDFDILLNAVVTAELAEALANPEADLTVFAPRDSAFIRLAQDLGYEGHDEAGAFSAIVSTLNVLDPEDPIGLLSNILLYHVAGESLSRKQVLNSDSIKLLNGGTIVPFGRKLLDAEPDLSNPRIIRRASNIKASNGIIHTIDRVLIPADLPNTPADAKSIAAIVASSGGKFDRNWFDYDILLNALQAADLVDALDDPNADLTVFAPNDVSFIRLARNLGYRGFRESGAFDFIVSALTELGNGDLKGILTTVLTYHVSPGSKALKDVILADSIDTLADITIKPMGIRLKDKAPSLRDPRLSIFFNEIRASNGIIHNIDRVLIPVQISE